MCSTNRLYQCKAKKGKPKCCITNDHEIIVYGAESGTMELDAQDLFGFGLGEFAVKPTNKIKGPDTDAQTCE